MTPEERQQIRERAQWLLYAHEHELRPNDEEKMCRYCAVAVMDIPALLAALEGAEERLRKMTTMWGQAVQKHEQGEAEIARLQQERDEAVELLRGWTSYEGSLTLGKETNELLRRVQGEARTP